jgi:hypothetical protein
MFVMPIAEQMGTGGISHPQVQRIREKGDDPESEEDGEDPCACCDESGDVKSEAAENLDTRGKHHHVPQCT